jgi:hypothetical protein
MTALLLATGVLLVLALVAGRYAGESMVPPDVPDDEPEVPP